MASTTDDLQNIARELNKVRSAGQARAAIGAALIAITGGYQAVAAMEARSFLSIRQTIPDTAKGELNQARYALEAWYAEIKSTPGDWDYGAAFAQKKDLIWRAYVAVAGAEGAAGWTPTTSNLDVLYRSIIEAPGVFLGQVSAAAVQVGKAAGDVAGNAVGGILGGLGIVPVALIALGVLLYLKGFNPLRLLGKVAA